MTSNELKSIGLVELSSIETEETNGGLLGLLVAYALQGAVVGTLAMGIYASFEAGYNQATN